MDGFFAFLISIVAALLFYRLVERRHKIIIGKVALGLAVLLLAGLGIILWANGRQRAAEGRQRESVTITLIEPSDSARRARGVGDPLARFRNGAIPQDFSAVTFRVCNEGREPVGYVRFRANSYIEGRSTAYPLRVEGGTWEREYFSTDYILSPGRCSTLTWSGRFSVQGPVVATAVEVRTTDNSPGSP